MKILQSTKAALILYWLCAFQCISHATTISVQTKLELKKKKSTFQKGDSIKMTCTVEGEPGYGVFWLKDAQSVLENPNYIVSEADYTLTIRDAKEEDEGTFICFAIGTGNSHNYSAIDLRYGSAPKISLSPRDQTTVEGYNATFTCSAEGVPSPKITWRNRFGELKGWQYSFSDGTLIVRNVAFHDNLAYTCVAKNEWGEQTATASLSVKDRTLNMKKNDDFVNLVAGEDAVLECKVTVDSTLKTTATKSWKRNGDLIDDHKSRFQLSGDSLTILNATIQDSGNYSCTVTTKLDHVTVKTFLRVRGVPEAPILGDVVCKQFMANVSWTSGNNNGEPIVSFIVQQMPSYSEEWEDAGTLEATSKSLQMQLTLTPYVTYRFRVVATNSLGRSVPSKESERCTTPASQPTMNPTNVAYNKTHIFWEPLPRKYHFGPGFTYDIYFRPLNSSIRWKMLISTIESSYVHPKIESADKTFEIKVRASNQNGYAPDPEAVPVSLVDREDWCNQELEDTTIILTKLIYKWDNSNEFEKGKMTPCPGWVCHDHEQQPGYRNIQTVSCENESSWPKDVYKEGVWTEDGRKCVACGRTSQVTLEDSGDDQSQAGQLPWTAAVFLFKDGQWQFKCGGTLILPRVVLSAANCITFTPDENQDVPQPQAAQTLRVGIGSEFNIDSIAESNSNYYEVMDIKVPPAYKGFSLSYESDWSFLVLKTPPIPVDNPVPVCMDWKSGSTSIYEKPGSVAVFHKDKKSTNNLIKRVILSHNIEVAEECRQRMRNTTITPTLMGSGRTCIMGEKIKDNRYNGVGMTQIRNGHHYLRFMGSFTVKNAVELNMIFFTSLSDGANLDSMKELLNSISMSIKVEPTEESSSEKELVDCVPGEYCPPQITTNDKQVTSIEGTNATLPCEFIGHPKPNLLWNKGNTRIKPAGCHYMLGDDGALTILNVTNKDAGEYKCIVYHNTSHDEHSIKLITPGKMTVKVTLIGSVYLHGEAKLKCEVQGGPPSEISWYYNSKIIEPNNTQKTISDDYTTLTIRKFLQDYNGIYTCTAKNSVDLAHGEKHLSVQ